MAPTLNDLLSPYPPAIRKIVLEARDLLRRGIPDPVETVDRENLGIGIAGGYAGLIFTVTPYADHVNLGIYDGARLPDPKGLLEGSGKRHRHVKLYRTEDLDNPALKRLIAEAIKAKRAKGKGRGPTR